MTPERYERVVNLFQQALSKTGETRDAFVAEACGDDTELRHQIEDMLAADEEETEFLAEPPGDLATEALQGYQQLSFIGQTLGEYRVLARLGTGGMGEVFLAEDTRLRRKVALKLLPPEFASDTARLTRFEREACAVSALNHPNIVTVYGLGQVENVIFLATEFVDGTTLRDAMTEGPLPIDRVTDLGLQIALALQAAHAYGLVHRDIKLENIMVRRDGLVKVLDFGLAKWTGAESAIKDLHQIASGQTTPGLIIGTPRYMSPEQARGLPVDCRTDLFSLGAVLYEALAGRPAMQGTTASDIIASILTRDPEPLAAQRPDCPRTLIAVISRALEKDREQRYSSATEMIVDLRSVTSAPTRSQNAPARNALRLNWKAVTVAAASAALVIVAIILFFHRSPNSVIDSVAVLPMANEGGSSLQFVADGLTDSLIGDLSEIPNLKVSSRAAAFQFQHEQPDPAKTGKLLNARKVLEGGVSQRADRLLIHLELVEAKTNRRIWGERYTTIWKDLLGVEGAISGEVVRKLEVRLTRNTQEELQKRHDVRPEAYRLYLRGQSALHGPTQADLEAAVLYLHRALENDSSYGPAAVDLANAYVALADYISPREAMPKAREYALKAIEVGGATSGAHATLGLVKLLYDWDWQGAAQELNWDTPLNPQAVETFSCYLHYRDAVQRTSKTETKMASLLARDPLSAWMNHEMGCASYYARHYEKAIEQFSRTVKINPDFQIAYANAGRTFVQQRKYREAISTLEAGRNIDPNWPLILSELAYAHAAAGNHEGARQILTELELLAKRRYVDAVPIALVYLRMGDRDTAFSYLEKAYTDRSSSIPWVRAEPRFDPVRSDPRYLGLLKRIGLSE